MPERYAAVDFGASSGRVLVGRFDGARVELTELARFANTPVRLPDGLRWNLLGLFAQTLEALRGAGTLASIGVDTWAVDYGLLDEHDRLLGVPFHYRDGRGAAQVERAFGLVAREEQYAITGIQTLEINTVFQLLAENGALRGAAKIAMVPDLIALWLSGVHANERTNASSTGLLDARSGEWAHGLIDRLGLPARPFAGLVDPGITLGPVLPAHALGDAQVVTVASHDTASAFAAAPIRDAHDAILSSGTWSLLGVESPHPVLSDAAREANLTNERGVDGTTRLLKNVMGLWLEQECARAWGADHAELFAEAAAVDADVPLFDPDRPELLAAGEMPARIAAACGDHAFASRGELIRSILVSLACKYRWVLERLEQVSGRRLHRIHVVGGGVHVPLLCELTAQITGREVIAGASEATALGNVLVQMRAAGELASLAQLRDVAAASSPARVHAPGGDDATYQRFLEVTRLPTTTPTHA